MTTRRSFLKKCALATCACYFSPFIKAVASTPTEDAPVSNTEEDFHLHWIQELLLSIQSLDLTEEELRKIIKKTSKAHNGFLNVNEMVKPYVGKPDEFIEFLEKTWGWIVKKDSLSQMLVIDENKPFCVCPLLKNAKDKLFPALCYCSEGFAELMFSAVYGYPVNVTVAASVQRGNKSCVYHVKY